MPIVEVDQQWHLDKKVPIALILALFMQSSAIVWWAASISSRVSRLEETSLARAPMSERLTRVEERIIFLQESSVRIEALVRNISPKQ